MRYLSSNDDNSVAVITLFPVKIVRQSDNLEMPIIGQRRTASECVIYGEEEFVVGDADYDIGDLTPSTIPDFTLVFPDIEKDIIGKWVEKSRQRVVSVREFSKEELPSDRYFRGAWEDNGKLEVNMEKARAIHKDVMRTVRKPLLEELDVAYQKADEIADGSSKAALAKQKQILRDVTTDPTIETALTPEELKAVWPECLGEAVF